MKKGFTLIELLAVIVILAIIALIATPIILNIIGGTKEKSKDLSKELYLRAVNQAIATRNLTEEFNPSECTVKEDGNLSCDTGELTVDVNGIKPYSGSLIFKDGKVVKSTLKFHNENNDDKHDEEIGNSCILSSDENGDGNPDVGDMVTCGTEKFYIVPDHNNAPSDTISMLTEKAITLDLDNPVQSDESGTISFSETSYWSDNSLSFIYNEQSNLYPYVEAYVKTLSKYGLTNVKGTLISEEQLSSLGCTQRGGAFLPGGGPVYSCDNTYEWIDSINYWTGIGYENFRPGVSSIFYSYAIENGACTYESYNQSSYLIRPVIIINKSELKK